MQGGPGEAGRLLEGWGPGRRGQGQGGARSRRVQAEEELWGYRPKIGTGPAPRRAARAWPEAEGATGPCAAGPRGQPRWPPVPRRPLSARDTGNILLTCKGGQASCKGVRPSPHPIPDCSHLQARAHRSPGLEVGASRPSPVSKQSPHPRGPAGSRLPAWVKSAWHTHHRPGPAALRQAAATPGGQARRTWRRLGRTT